MLTRRQTMGLSAPNVPRKTVLARLYSAQYLAELGEPETNGFPVARRVPAGGPRALVRPVWLDARVSFPRVSGISIPVLLPDATRYGPIPYTYYVPDPETGRTLPYQGEYYAWEGWDRTDLAGSWSAAAGDDGGDPVSAVEENCRYGWWSSYGPGGESPYHHDCAIPIAFGSFSSSPGAKQISECSGADRIRREYGTGGDLKFYGESYAAGAFSLTMGGVVQPFWGAAPPAEARYKVSPWAYIGQDDQWHSDGPIHSADEGVWAISFEAEVSSATMWRGNDSDPYTEKGHVTAKIRGWLHSDEAFHRFGPDPRTFTLVSGYTTETAARGFSVWMSAETEANLVPAARADILSALESAVSGLTATVEVRKHGNPFTQQQQ